MPDPTPENRRLFESVRDHMNEAGLKNSELLDKSILSLSSAGLVLSLSFTKYLKPISEAEHISLLHTSWICFGLAIILTVSSFLTTNVSITVIRDHGYKYYLEGNQEYANKKNHWGAASLILNLFSALCFLIAVATTVSYIWTNTQQEEIKMSQDNKTVTKGYVPPKLVPSSGSNNSQGQNTQSQSTTTQSNKK